MQGLWASAGCLSPELRRLLRGQGGVSDSEPWGQRLAALSRHVRILAEQVRSRGRPPCWGGLRIHRPHRMDANTRMGALPPPALQAWK